MRIKTHAFLCFKTSRSFFINSFLLMFCLVQFINTNAKNNRNYFSLEDFSTKSFPDSLFEDSLSVYENGDTVNLFTSGQDTLIVIYASENEDTSTNEKLIPFATEDMVISINSNYQAVQHGLYGINVSDLFEHAGELTPAGLPNPYCAQAWDAIARLDPKVVRAFSGSGSKFMHPLGSDNTDLSNPFVGTRNGGYGYNIEELIRYYDFTDDLGNYPGWASFLLDMAGAQNVTWIQSGERTAFLEFYNKWNNKPYFDTAVIPILENQPLYINQFIRLIELIETTNTLSGKVDVLIALNILSQTSNEMKDMFSYLTTDNTIYPVKIAGVEMGNECYFPSHNRLIGFSDFDHYWYYINGGNDYQTEFSDPLDFDLTDILSPAMQADHNFIGDLRAYLPVGAKIGIPAENLANGDGWAFKTANPEDTLYAPTGDPGGFSPCELDWNQCLALHYGEMAGEDYAFDAVILHPYYTPGNDPAVGFGTNWGRIPTNYDTNPLTPNHLDNDISIDNGYQDFTTSQYTYATPDARLQTAFQGMVGIPISDDGGVSFYEGTGNIKTLIRTRYQAEYVEHANVLNFQNTDVGSQYKELWTTEWNLHDGDKLNFMALLDPDRVTVTERLAVYSNTLVHLDLLQEWYLKNLKINIQPGYRHNFFTYATLQNIAGGSNIDVLSNSHYQDQINLGFAIPATCDEDDILPDYYIRKGSYYGYSLLKTIYEKNLNYISSTTSMYVLNNNLAPTVFLAPPSEQKLYIYYTNIKSIPQRYIIDPNNLVTIYTGAAGISFSTPSILCVDPQQLYSTSGRSAILDKITNQYPCSTSPLTYPNWFDLSAAAGVPGFGFVSCPPGVPADCKCVEVPATSVGYFEIPFTLLRLGELEDIYRIYPNPSSEYFIVELITPIEFENKDFQVDIFNMTGSLIKSRFATEGQKISVSDLAVGVYNVVIKKEGLRTESEVFVKMK